MLKTISEGFRRQLDLVILATRAALMCFDVVLWIFNKEEKQEITYHSLCKRVRPRSVGPFWSPLQCI
jgi:hypothetical protein